MQLVRKSKTIQQDKLRSLPTCFLANMLQDYYHNLEKHKVNVKLKLYFRPNSAKLTNTAVL